MCFVDNSNVEMTYIINTWIKIITNKLLGTWWVYNLHKF